MLKAIGIFLIGSSTGIIGAHFDLPFIVSLAVYLFTVGFLMTLDSIVNKK